MLSSVAVGEELMPHRIEVNETRNAQPDSESEEAPHRVQVNEASNAQAESESEDAQAALPTTPIRKLCRNRGLVMQEQSVVEDSPESNDTAAARAAAIRKGKRKIR